MSFNGRLIVGIAGVKRSGKDTIANHLVKKHGFYKRSFAQPLKDVCKCLFGFSDNQLNGSDKEIPDEKWFGITPRETLQFVGTDLLRKQMSKLRGNFGEDIFIHSFRNWYEDEKNITKKLIVVPDVRFQNEVDYIHNQNGFVIKILYNATADEVSLLDRIKNFFGLNDEHESEAQNLDYDLTVNNGFNCTFMDLYSQVDAIMEQKFKEALNC